MSAIDDLSTSSDEELPIVLSARDLPQPTWLDRLDAKLAILGDRLNPILVKETRQALKSRQFTITFALLLICGVGWSIMGAVINMPEIYYAPTGQSMLVGYYFILGIPLLIVVPFSAFRSLSSEREDGTYELLSISALSSRQIVTGKLGSAIIQMIVYYSALAPCIVFTYLLRGIDILTIVHILVYTFLASILFSSVGIMFAGISGSRTWQMFTTVSLLAALVFATIGWFNVFFAMMRTFSNQVPFREPVWWIANAAWFSGYVSYLALAILVAAAQNSFASDNRSTKLRIAMLSQSILFVGWTAWMWSTQDVPWQVLCAMLFLAAFHWYVYGVFLSGEGDVLSPRVKRSLPMSIMGRVFLTWFNPGSGTGYMFAVCNVVTLATFVLFAFWLRNNFGVPSLPSFGGTAPTDAVACVVLTVEYFILYLGLGRLLIVLIPDRSRFNFMLPVLVHLLVALAAFAIPLSVQAFMRRGIDYTAWQSPNWIWTLERAIEGRLSGVSVSLFGGSVSLSVPMVVGIAAALIFVVNMVVTAREVEFVRLATPARVREDDAQLADDLK